MANLRVLGFTVVLFFGCSRAKEGPPPAPQVTERQPLVSAASKRPLGASCDDVGPYGCAGGVCLKVGAARGSGRRCSRSCAADHSSCGAGYACAQVFASTDSWFCAPLEVTP